MATETNQIEPRLLELLRCPETGQRLKLAGPDLLTSLPSGSEPFSEALVREDGEVLYPISNGIPVLIRDRAVRIAPARATEPPPLS